MFAGVDFRVIFSRLRHAKQSFDFWKQRLQCAAGTQYPQEFRWAALPHGANHLGPDSLRNEVIQLAGFNDTGHQFISGWMHIETERTETGSKTRHP